MKGVGKDAMEQWHEVLWQFMAPQLSFVAAAVINTAMHNLWHQRCI